MPLSSPHAVLADVLLGGSLETNLRTWRASGDSFETIARRIWAATDEKVSVSGQTVSNWFDKLEGVA